MKIRLPRDPQANVSGHRAKVGRPRRERAFGSGSLRPGDRVFAPIPSNAPLAFYFAQAGLDPAYLSSVPTDSSRVYVVVNTAEGFALKTSLRERLLQKYTKARLVGRYPSAEVYQLH